MRTPLLVVGDALLDRDTCGRAERLAPDAPVPVLSGTTRTARPGGAALAARLAAADGRDVTLVTALGDDPASARLRQLLDGWVRVVAIPLHGGLPVKTRFLAGGRPLLRLDHGDGRAAGATRAAEEAIAGASAVLVSDYGRGTADALRDALAAAAARVPVVWDPHPRGGPPVRGVRLATPSAAEAGALAPAPLDANDGRPNGWLRAAAHHAAALVRVWRVTSVAVTLGERGVLLSHGGAPLFVPVPWQAAGDACGAGDRFAASAAGLLGDDALPEDALQGAVRSAARYVADGGARAYDDGHPPPDPARTDETQATTVRADVVEGAAEEAAATVARVRAAGGTVIAAGGCFDLLHAGHVGLLQAARRTGDCLVVCLNSDASVRRRKGPGRPIVPVGDRIRVLRALACVDAVAVFDEPTPERLLGELRPDVWVKGGDYGAAELPETALLESWGGQVLLLPYLDGRSTTALARSATGTTPSHGRGAPGAPQPSRVGG